MEQPRVRRQTWLPGTYMRVDFFATDRGCVFNEFASMPANGDGFTPFCDELFGASWDEKFPHAT